MAAPTVSAVTPATVVAGAKPVAFTATGTGFLTGIVVSAPNLVFFDIAEGSGTGITGFVYAKGGATRGPNVVTFTNTDATTVNHAGPSVVTPAVNTGGEGNYPYANALPGTAPGTASIAGTLPDSSIVGLGAQDAPEGTYHDAVTSPSEAKMFDLNPAFAPAAELAAGVASVEDGITVEVVDQQQIGQPSVTDGAILGPNDGLAANDPGRIEDAGDIQGQETDHSAQIPNPPTAPTLVAAGTGHLTAGWTAPVDADGYGITGYIVTPHTSDGGTLPAVATVGNVLTVSLSGAQATKHYTITVQAVNVEGTSVASAASASVAAT